MYFFLFLRLKIEVPYVEFLNYFQQLCLPYITCYERNLRELEKNNKK